MDVFDEIDDPKQDIFDDLDPVVDERGRRRVQLLGEQAAAMKEGDAADRAAARWQLAEDVVEPFTGRGIVNQPARVMAALGGVRDTMEDPLNGPIVRFPKPEGSSVGAGLDRLAGGLLEGLTDPNTLVTLPAGAARAGLALFGADMARHLPEQVERAAQVSGDIASTPGAITEAIGEPIITAGMMTGIGHAAGRANLPRYISIEEQLKNPELYLAEDANRAAVNLAAPGTVRPTEISRFGPPETALEAPAFSVGDVPFERMQRFGGQELPPVEILPQMGRLPDVEILSEPRSLLERETRGKTSFGASAPTLLRNAQELPPDLAVAIQRAEGMGLSKSAAEALAPERFFVEQSADVPLRTTEPGGRAVLPEASRPKNEGLATDPLIDADTAPKNERAELRQGVPEAGQTGQTAVPGMRQPGVGETPSGLQQTPEGGLAVPKTSPTPPPTSETAWIKGSENRSPEGIAKLEAELLDVTERLKTAIAEKKPFDALLKEKQLAREAVEVAKGEQGDLATDWLAKREADPVASLKAFKGTEGTKAAQDTGAKIATREQLADLKAAHAEAEAAVMEKIRKAETDADIDAISNEQQRAGLLKEAIEGALGLGRDQKYDKAKLHPGDMQRALAEYKERMAGDTPIAMEANILERADAALADLQNKLKGKTFTGITGLEPVIADLAITAARAALKATNSVAKAIAAAIEYVRTNHPDAKFDPDAFRKSLMLHLGDTPATPTATAAKPASAGVPPTPAPGAPTPATPTSPARPTPPGAPTPPVPGAPRVSLDDVYKRFELDPKSGPSIGQRIGQAVEAVRTGLSSRFRPLNKLAEDIAKAYGGAARDVAGIFEQLKGSSGKAEADVYRFDREVSDAVKGSERDFNAYMFLRRSLDRLAQDAATGETRRKVSGYTSPDLQAKLALLEGNLGPDKVAEFQRAADAYQVHLDQALQQQVTSGRMSVEVYEAIKDGNQFYAPFKVMKWIDETSRPEGTGRRIDTTADLTKAMVGIEDGSFKLGDILSAGRQNITMSRILAEKNLAMQNLTDLSGLDVSGTFIQKLASGQDAPKGMEAVNVMESGKVQRYAVDKNVAEAVQIFGPQSGQLVARISSGLFRAGATTFNIPFQFSNLLADIPRQAMVSKYGINSATDLVRWPMDLIHSIYSSISGNVFGAKNKLFLDFLDSGAAGTTVQKYLTPDALEFKAGDRSWFENSLNTVGSFADAIEQTSKILGIKRAMRQENIGTGKSLARFVPEAITEIRRFSGSPDFGRMGKWVDSYRLNLLYMFLNARIQGSIADVGRLTGRDGAGTAAKTWGKVGVSVGIPTAYLYWLNNSDEYREDYAKRPDQEKRNYWLIPKDKFIETADGEKMRDYWRIPKREVAKWTANTVEAGLDFAREKDPESLINWGTTMAEELVPVNIHGKNLQERVESVGSGLNPLLKAPLEFGSGRDLYRHKDIVPDKMKKASPEQQYTDRTSEVFKTLADKMPDVAPEVFRSPLMLENMTKNLTAGLITQFLPRKEVKGRTELENQPLAQRFQAVPFTDSTEFDKKIQGFEREAADDQLNRYRAAQKIIDENKNAKPDVLIKKVIAQHGRDEKLAERVIDLYVANQNGVTTQERRILALPVEQRATFIAGELAGKDPSAKAALIKSYAAKRILTEGVAEAMVRQGSFK